METLDLTFHPDDPDLGLSWRGEPYDNNGISAEIENVKNTVQKIILDGQEYLTAVPEILKDCPVLNRWI
jgi:hypothetical protein